MEEHGFGGQPSKPATAGEVLRAKRGEPLVALSPDEPASRAVVLMEQHGFSTLPVIEDGRVVGSINEVTLARLLYDGADLEEKRVGEVMGKPLPQLDERTDVSEPYRLLLAGHGGVVVTRAGRAHGFLSRIESRQLLGAARRAPVPAGPRVNAARARTNDGPHHLQETVMATIYKDNSTSIGNTPLVRLNRDHARARRATSLAQDRGL